MTKRTYPGMYRGVHYDGDYDLDRSDIVSILGPQIDVFFADMERIGKLPATFTIFGTEVQVFDVENVDPFAFDIPARMRLALLDRQMAPERDTPVHITPVTDEERATWNRIWDLCHGANAIPGTIYLSPYDFPVVRKIDTMFVEWDTHPETMKLGLYAFVLNEELETPRPLHVAAEVPSGYAYAPPDVDEALKPLCTRPEGAVPKLQPKYLYLLDP